MTDFISGEDYLKSAYNPNPKQQENLQSVFKTVPESFAYGLADANLAEDEDRKQHASIMSTTTGGQFLSGIHQTAMDYLKSVRDHIEVDHPEVVGGNGLSRAQRWADNAANFIGSQLTPLSVASIPFAGGLGGKSSSLLANTAVKGTKQLPKIASAFAENVMTGGLIGAAFAIPQALNHDHSVSDVVSDISESGAFGMALGTVPFIWGVLKGNVPRRTHRGLSEPGAGRDGSDDDGGTGGEDYTPRHTDEEKDFMQKYEANGKKITPELQAMAASIADKRGIEHNAVSKKVSVPIIPKNDIDNMQHAILDQMNRGLDGDLKNALSDFITAKNLDTLSADDTSINGLRGFVDHVQSEMAKKAESFKAIDESIAHKAESETGEVEDSNPISQQKLFDELKSWNGDLKSLPINIPGNVRKLISDNKKDFSSYINKYLNEKFERLDVDKDLTQHDFFHGSGRLENVKDFEISQASESSLYGQGLYITDDKKVALTYSKVRAKSSSYDKAKIFGLRFKNQPKLIDVEKSSPKNVLAIIEKQASDSGIELSDKQKKMTISHLFSDLKYSLRDDYDLQHADEIYTGFMTDLNTSLHDAGYDGYLHTGGVVTSQKVKHNVTVLFGQSYYHNGKWINKNPADLLEEHEIDLAHKFENNVDEFKKITGTHPSNENIKPVLSPKEELQSIRDKLLPNGELVNDVSKHEEYKRLTDLSKVWNAAEILKDRIDLEQSLNRKKAFADMADQLVKLADQKGEKPLADLQKVYDYLQQDPSAPKSNADATEQARLTIERGREIPADIERQLADIHNSIEDEKTKKGFSEAADAFKELKANESIFKNLIGCLIGARA